MIYHVELAVAYPDYSWETVEFDIDLPDPDPDLVIQDDAKVEAALEGQATRRYFVEHPTEEVAFLKLLSFDGTGDEEDDPDDIIDMDWPWNEETE